MALHGTINVNEEMIMYWSAVRKEMVDSIQDDHIFRYECFVSRTTPDEKLVIEFDIPHAYEDGAETLLIKILQEFNRKLKHDRYDLTIPPLR